MMLERNNANDCIVIANEGSLAGRLTALALPPFTTLGLVACGADRAADGSDPIKTAAPFRD
jgi:hypothetical protein